jgi:ribonuclease T2
MKRIAAIVALTFYGLVARAAAPGDFDYYMLEQSWLPEFCAGTVAYKPTKMPHPECNDIESRFGATRPTVHGLWPQDRGGNHPFECAGSPGCAARGVCPIDGRQIDDNLEKELGDRWMPGYPSLADHEWKRHGTCSGLDQQAYFAATAAIAAKVPVQAIPLAKIGQDVEFRDLEQWWGEPRAAFLCHRRKGRQYLAAVRTCWKRNQDRTPGERLECPATIRDTCLHNKKVTLMKAKNLGAAGTASATADQPACSKPGQGPPCKSDKACKDIDWLRCAKSRCCTNQPK